VVRAGSHRRDSEKRFIELECGSPVSRRGAFLLCRRNPWTAMTS
jgi:hypothetical protein